MFCSWKFALSNGDIVLFVMVVVSMEINQEAVLAKSFIFILSIQIKAIPVSSVKAGSGT